MSPKEARIEIENLAKELENRKHEKSKTVLILGSKAGAIFRNPRFYEEIAYFSLKTMAGFSITEQFSEAYATLIQEKSRNTLEDLRIFLTSAIGSVMHSAEDTNLAELVKQELFNTIFSLNMDDLLYNAFIRHEMKHHQDFADFAFGPWKPESVVQEIFNYTRPNICKLIRIYNDEQAFIYRLNNEKAHEEYSGCMRRLLEKWQVREVLIVGWDPTWDHMLPSALPASLRTVWFVNEDENAKREFLVRYQSCELLYYTRATYKSFCNGLLTQVAPDFISLHDFNRTALHDIQAMRQEVRDNQEQIERANKRIEAVQTTITSMREDIINELAKIHSEIRSLQQKIDGLS